MRREPNVEDSDSVLAEYARLELTDPLRPEDLVSHPDTDGAPAPQGVQTEVGLAPGADRILHELTLRLSY